MPRKEASLNLLPIITIILAAVVVGLVVATILTEFGNFGIAQGQVNMTSSSLTPEQKAKICDPNDPFVNSTESEICGVPKTINAPTNATSVANTTSSENNNTTSGAIAPSVVP